MEHEIRKAYHAQTDNQRALHLEQRRYATRWHVSVPQQAGDDRGGRELSELADQIKEIAIRPGRHARP